MKVLSARGDGLVSVKGLETETIVNTQSHPSAETPTVEPKTTVSGKSSDSTNQPASSNSTKLDKKSGPARKRLGKAPGKSATKHGRLAIHPLRLVRLENTKEPTR